MFLRDILGQERVIGFLRQSLRSNQIPHALLFLGSEGVGKESTALALAQALNCENRQPDQDACGQCRSCRLYALGNHPDFWRISPEKRVGPTSDKNRADPGIAAAGGIFSSGGKLAGGAAETCGDSE